MSICSLSIPGDRPMFFRPIPRKLKQESGKRVTVCIAAISCEGYIVTASDMMIACALSSSDVATIKLEQFHKEWIVMMAGDDITQALPIIGKAETYFQKRANTLNVARNCFKRAYQNHLGELAADNVLGRFGLDMETFRKSGRRRFTEPVFNSLCEEIRKVKASCQFLACGFDEGRRPHLFVVDEPGTDSVYDKPGFCAIGSGSYAATGMLYYLEQRIDRTVHETIFNVCAAKYMAEKIPGVGAETFLHVKAQGCQAFTMETWVEPTIRKVWNDQGRPRVPQGIIEQIKRAHMAFIPAIY